MKRKGLRKIGFLLGSFSLLFGSHAEGESDAQVALYKKHCQRCHAETGEGNPKIAKPLKLKDVSLLNMLRSEAKSKTDDELLKLIINGKDKMPAFKEKMSADEAKMMLQYIRQLQSKAK